VAELYLVRHAQAGRLGGDYDRLSDLGIQQAEYLGRHFAEMGIAFDRIACGRLRRQAMTVEAMAPALMARPALEVLPGLDEYDFDNLAEAFFELEPEPADFREDRRVFFRTLRKALLAWSRDELPAGRLKESWGDFTGRIAGALQDLCDPARGERVLAVSSGGAIAMVLREVLGLSPEVATRLNLQTKNTGISRFIFTDRAIYLSSFNAAPHLETPERQHFVTYS